MLEVFIIPLTTAGVVEYIGYITSSVRESFSRAGLELDIVEWPETVKPSLKCYDWARLQYLASCLVNELYEYFTRLRVAGSKYVIGIGEVDGYEPGLNFVFGLAVPARKTGVVFTKRLREEYYGKKPSYDLYVERVIKEVVHELGHLLGLDHCDYKKCVMSFSNSILDVDYKERFFCEKCSLKLRELHAHRGIPRVVY
ncbi:archaemetzincin family Zn-dependent metalloprotease [Thermogladius sp. 4427co]|uniref:archaemetzincin family Zn-dependent metalloprotease n=1 Tax=Thermogladius sp. 4427co TaxID=3450718 RepID=UPI003F78B61B